MDTMQSIKSVVRIHHVKAAGKPVNGFLVHTIQDNKYYHLKSDLIAKIDWRNCQEISKDNWSSWKEKEVDYTLYSILWPGSIKPR